MQAARLACWTIARVFAAGIFVQVFLAGMALFASAA